MYIIKGHPNDCFGLKIVFICKLLRKLHHSLGLSQLGVARRLTRVWAIGG